MADTATYGQAPKDDAAPKTPNFDALLANARTQFRLVAEAENQLRSDQLDDKRFRASQQWPQHLIAERIRDKRPYLTVNRLPQFIKQITNQQRASRPSIQVNPVDDSADPDTAQVLQGVIRHIEHASHAQVAYDTATEDQVTMGRGYIRIVTEYEDEMGFQQCIRIRRVRNPHSVYVDPNAVEPDYSDAQFGFQVEDMDPATFTQRYPKAIK